MSTADDKDKKKHWILIVDDEDEIRSLITEKVKDLTDEKDEFKIVEARDGFEATQKLRNQKFDCIVTDLNMPKRTGQELIQNAKASELNARTPIIVVTAYPDATLPEQYMYLTMLEKPFKVNDLMKVVQEQIKLGPIDQRVPVHIFNLFLSSTEKYFKDTFKLDLNRQSPHAKKSSDDFNGRTVVTVRLAMGTIRTWIALSAEGDFLKHFAKALRKEETQVLEYFTHQIMGMLSSLENRNAKLEIQESLLLTPQNIHDYQLNNLQGISVPFKSIYGGIYCEAMVGQFTMNKKK